MDPLFLADICILSPVDKKTKIKQGKKRKLKNENKTFARVREEEKNFLRKWQICSTHSCLKIDLKRFLSADGFKKNALNHSINFRKWFLLHS